MLAEALRAAHREDEAGVVEMQIVSKGPVTDPRTCSLYLATRRTNSELALRLARRELAERADVFTHDALAWALAAAGKFDEAQSHLRLALAQGTQDARLAFHAARARAPRRGGDRAAAPRRARLQLADGGASDLRARTARPRCGQSPENR